MPASDFAINPNIRPAHLLPTDFYRNPIWFGQSVENIFAKSWQCIGMKSHVNEAGLVQPFLLMEGSLQEPLILTCDQNQQLHCLSNVCTSCGNILVSERRHVAELRCSQDEEVFQLDGSSETAERLPQLALHEIGDLLFTGIEPEGSFEAWMGPIHKRIEFLPFDRLTHLSDYSQNEILQVNWSLYIDHLLRQDGDTLQRESFSFGMLATRTAETGIPQFDLPGGHSDQGKSVAAYHAWLFPNLRLDLYPWGMVLGIIEPIGHVQTRVRNEYFLWNEEHFNPLMADALFQSEQARQLFVQTQQIGVQSRLFRGKMSKPDSPVAVFHKMISERLGK